MHHCDQTVNSGFRPTSMKIDQWVQTQVHHTVAHKANNGTEGQDKNIIVQFSIFVCTYTYHKTNGTNGKVIFQGFISAKTKNTFSSFVTSKLEKTSIFRGFPCNFQMSVQFFWLMLYVIPVCHFEGQSIIQKNTSDKK